MELLYIWVEDYGIIKEQGFNFGGEFLFEYCKQSEVLSFRKNANYIPDLFNTLDHPNSNIINVTAIIGQNGSGKTTILELIRNNIIKSKRKKNKILIICAGDSSQNAQFVCYGSEISIKNKSQLIKNKKFRFEDEYPINEQPYTLSGVTMFQKKYGIYYSSIFDSQEEFYDYSECNLSTNFLVKYDSNDLESNLINSVTIHKFSEIRRQIMFAREFPKTPNSAFEIPFEIPKNIFITPVEFIISGVPLYKYKRFINKVNEALDTYTITCSYTLNKKEDDDEKLSRELLRCKFYKTIFNVFFYDVCKLPSPNNFYNGNLRLSDLRGKTILDKLDYFFNKINRIEKADLFFSHSHLLEVLNEIIEIVDNKCISSNSIMLRINSLRLNNLLQAYSQTLKENQYLIFEWRNLSSGERALLNLFSRFHATRSSYELVKEAGWSFNHTVLILIDEAELYLHTQWQKELFFNLLQFLQYVYSDYKLQIIFTSNSPFIVSELPHSNVIFIKKDGGKSRVIDQLPENNLTFASNIHTLLSNTFFMQDGLIGRFAKYKINKLLNLIVNSSSEELDKNHEEIEKLIGIIGEPIIKNKLSNLLQERLSTNIMSINKEIQFLKNKVHELERKLNKGD
ncbi:AAA family ATPase [Bacillus sp. REN10]|uniref:AAA family ATPase n=1 Tax=Bacillus sp. REN10 TaxID=2782541 RepID=UPI00193BAC74|nr:AAA family ATPase [Bacillus sp. REN10]